MCVVGLFMWKMLMAFCSSKYYCIC